MLGAIRLLLGITSLALLLIAVRAHILATEARSWPMTVGELDERGVFAYGAGSDGAASITGDTAIYARYTYHVGGKEYVGSKVRSWDMPFTKPGITPESLNPARPSGRVPVFYNPANPAEAVLDLAYPLAPVALLLLACVLCAIGAIFATKLCRGFMKWIILGQH